MDDVFCPWCKERIEHLQFIVERDGVFWHERCLWLADHNMDPPEAEHGRDD